MIDETKFVDELEEGLIGLGIQYQADGSPRYVAIYSKEAWMGAYKDKAIDFMNAHGAYKKGETEQLLQEGEKLFWELMRNAGTGVGAPIAVVEEEDDGQGETGSTEPIQG